MYIEALGTGGGGDIGYRHIHTMTLGLPNQIFALPPKTPIHIGRWAETRKAYSDTTAAHAPKLTNSLTMGK